MYMEDEHERSGDQPRDRVEALFELVVVTPFTVAYRVLSVVLGPRRVRALDEWISRSGGSTD